MERYDHKKIEAKWRKYWSEHPELFKADDKSQKEKQYILDMFPYPSSNGLHTGHIESYTATDIIARYMRMKGKNVLHPQGWDAFGLPAENYAIKTKTHPSITTKKAIANFTKQMNMMGFSYDWSREVNSSDPNYYKWTQWFFLLLYKNNLAYKAKAKANWCLNCQTVLANEQAEGGICERCKNTVVQKDMEQWFFKITDFIENKELLNPLIPPLKGGQEGLKKYPRITSGLIDGLDKVDWPESTKAAQKNWIGKSEGAQFKMKVKGSDLKIEFYTTRIDTVFGMTYAVMAPEHPVMEKLKSYIKNLAEISQYIIESKKKTELQRMSETKEKTGVELKGVKVINPFTKEAISLFISDYVLAHYGTGAIMAVPGHDQRDYEFAKKHNLEIREVIKSVDGKSSIEKEAFTDDGILLNSGEYNGLTSKEARQKITEWLEEKKIGFKKINYKIRDWLVSRQRYWGAPIPIIYCDKCKEKKYKYLLLHGRHGSLQGDFFPWLKRELESFGHQVYAPNLPNTEDPKVEEQADFVNKNFKIDSNTIIIGHSLGGAVAFNLLEKANKKVAKVVLVDTLIYPKFNDKKRPDLERNFNWKFNFEKIKKLSGEFVDLADSNFSIITKEQFIEKRKLLDTRLIYVKPNSNHFNSEIEPLILQYALMDGMFPVPKKDLPVELPTDVDFMPTGQSPLIKSKSFHKVKCPKCGGSARRESDTMDTFVCSSWYYLRYSDSKNKKEFASKEMMKKWLPVDLYVGGAEHTVLHLLYSRFFTKVLHNLGYIDFDEPFKKLRHQGIILAEDGRKMSKSFSNVTNPDEVVKQYGADSLRIFEMFMGPLEDAKSWNIKGIIGIYRFLDKVCKLAADKKLTDCGRSKTPGENVLEGLPRMLHQTIKKVGEDIESLRFNTAISQMMIFINFASKLKIMPRAAAEKFLIILAPFAPHLAEELWSELGHKESIFKQVWPKFNPELVKDEKINLVVQINGKVRDMVEVSANISQAEAKKIALKSEKIKKWLEGKEVVKIIFVKGKLVNIVITN